MITREQAERVLPAMRAAVDALHEVWAQCREVERMLDRTIDGLEGIVQDMAAGVDDTKSIGAEYVEEAINDVLGDEVSEGAQCSGCGERNPDHLEWLDDVTVKCITCGKRYRPPTK